ncbi:MAG: ABC transporter substrate-binding protein [Alphaproteobacteria bacterium]
MKKNILSILVVFIMLLAGFANVAKAQSKTKEDIKKFMLQLSTDVIALVQSPISYEEYSKRMSAMVDKHSAYDQLTAFVLGPYNRQISDIDRAKVKLALIDYFHIFFARQFKNYKGQTTVVENVQIGKNNVYTVRVNFVPPANSTTPMLVTDWRLWWHQGEFRVMDIIVNNISMIAVIRSETTSIIAQANGDINQLVNRLRQRARTVKVK